MLAALRTVIEDDVLLIAIHNGQDVRPAVTRVWNPGIVPDFAQRPIAGDEFLGHPFANPRERGLLLASFAPVDAMAPHLLPGVAVAAQIDARRDSRFAARFYEISKDVRFPAAPGGLLQISNGRVLVELIARNGARRAGRGLLGLYHFAILLPDRPTLGRFLKHLAQTGTRAAWQQIGRKLMMATDRLDIESILRDAGEEPWRGMPAGTVIGHVHLHVGDLAEARAFYSEALGFNRTTWHYPGALLMTAGGYHHFLGTNTWAGAGPRPPSEDDARLIDWSIELPSAGKVAAATQSLESAGYRVEKDGADALATDPWGTRVRLRHAQPSN